MVAVREDHKAAEPPLFLPAAMRLRTTDRPPVNDAEQPKPNAVNFSFHGFFSSLSAFASEAMPGRGSAGERVGVRCFISAFQVSAFQLLWSRRHAEPVGDVFG